MHSDEFFMRRALQLAQLGKGNVAPNPLVGAVIVYENQIIGEGYHQLFGAAHAEVNAVNSVRDKSLLKDATIYVTLEPCAHHGKTPPCADLLIQHRFNRVVVGCGDSFDQVNGKGIQRLKDAGIDVTHFVLEEECREMNTVFFTAQEKKRPFVFLKWAESSDGFIDSNQSKNGEITWISRPEVQPLVHKWRSEYQAILVGKNTVINDDPSLTVRAVAGKNPIRIVLDRNLKIPLERKVFNDQATTIILNSIKTEQNGTLKYQKISDLNAQSILNALYALNIHSVLVEGGARTLQSFIDSKLWDEACIIEGQAVLNDGTPAPKLRGTVLSTKSIFGDHLKFYRP